ncbi:putative protein without homology [Propionibacterium freudenreichii subsp. shermanii]|nr:putative protein without homology [Propionibacterium freudenreichii subsp. shermanii]
MSRIAEDWFRDISRDAADLSPLSRREITTCVTYRRMAFISRTAHPLWITRIWWFTSLRLGLSCFQGDWPGLVGQELSQAFIPGDEGQSAMINRSDEPGQHPVAAEAHTRGSLDHAVGRDVALQGPGIAELQGAEHLVERLLGFYGIRLGVAMHPLEFDQLGKRVAGPRGRIPQVMDLPRAQPLLVGIGDPIPRLIGQIGPQVVRGTRSWTTGRPRETCSFRVVFRLSLGPIHRIVVMVTRTTTDGNESRTQTENHDHFLESHQHGHPLRFITLITWWGLPTLEIAVHARGRHHHPLVGRTRAAQASCLELPEAASLDHAVRSDVPLQGPRIAKLQRTENLVEPFFGRYVICLGIGVQALVLGQLTQRVAGPRGRIPQVVDLPGTQPMDVGIGGTSTHFVIDVCLQVMPGAGGRTPGRPDETCRLGVVLRLSLEPIHRIIVVAPRTATNCQETDA